MVLTVVFGVVVGVGVSERATVLASAEGMVAMMMVGVGLLCLESLFLDYLLSVELGVWKRKRCAK